MSSSATASNIKTGSVQSNIEKSVVLLNDPAHGCTHRRTSNIVPTDIHRLSMVHCIHGYPWTVHGTLYPQISMDCLYSQISMDCPWYVVPTCTRISMDVPHTPWREKLLGNTMYPWISMDRPRTPWGRWLGKVTREYMDIHGLSAHPMGEIAGKVTQEYNVSMDSHGPSAHPMGEMAGKVTREYNVSMDPWTVHAPPWIHGLSTHLMGLIPCIARSLDLRRKKFE